MSAIRVVESTGSLGTLQVTDGYGGFLTGSLVAGTNVSITTNNSGSFTINAAGGGSGGSITFASGSTTVNSGSVLAASDGFILNDEGLGRAALTASIGIAEDGDYTDGLFKDFTPQTRLGVAIDRFNEILSLLAPAPAPDLDDIDNDNSGASSVELSFGISNDLTGSTPPYYSVDNDAGFSALDINDTYGPASSSNNIRVGAFGSLRNIVGSLNEDVTQDPPGTGNNYPNNAFGNADKGELRLEVNGEIVHTTDLTSFSSGNTNLTGSCFTNLLVATAGELDNGSSFENFKHRTGGYKIVTGDQRQGWNYARVLHVYDGTTLQTNFVEWVNDTNSDALAAAASSLEFTGAGSIHLSGVEYFTNGSATFKTRVSNAYRNVYDTNQIQFPTSNAGSIKNNVSFSIGNQNKDPIDTAGGEDHTKVLHLTGSGNVTANYMLSGSITAGVTATHPFKTDLTNGGQASDEGILLYNLSNTSDEQLETFRRENFRIISGSYDTQNSLTASLNEWDSEVFMTASNGGHSNGLQFFDRKLYSPLNTLNGGNFSTFSNGPEDNPDYSGETGQRTFYRWFKNESGATQYDLTINIQGTGTQIVSSSTSLNSGNVRVFIKFPNNGSRETGWLDLAEEFILDEYEDNDGAKTTNGALSFTSNLSLSGVTNYVSLGTVGIQDDEYIGIRIEADTSWTGYIQRIEVTFGAGNSTISPIPNLNEIDCNDSGVTAKLSFGSTKSITDYSNVGTTAGFSAVGLNGTYNQQSSGNNLRRGVFDKTTIIEGDLNESVNAVSNGSRKNHTNNAFADANSGSLVLEVNGDTIHRVELTGSYNLVGSGNPGSGTGTSFTGNSGFFDLSVWKPAEHANSVPHYLEVYRTGKFRVHTDDQRDGWNYARVVHSGSWGVRETNFVEWVNDSESQNNNITSAGSVITQFGDDDIFHLSGVKYFVNPTGSIETRISNIYKNIYSNSSSAISLTSLSNVTAVSITQRGLGLTSDKIENDGNSPLQSLNTNSDSQNEVLHVTGTIQFNQTYSLSSSFQSALRVNNNSISNLNCGGTLRFIHPFKTQEDVSQTTNNLLVFSASDNSNGSNEYFDGEKFRLQSGSYATETEVFSSLNKWSSTGSLNNNVDFPSYYSGLMVYGGLLMSPLDGGNAGNFRNKHETSNTGIFEGPDDNVDYSSLGEDIREYFRYFTNPTTNDVSRIGLTIKGDAILATQDSGHSNTGTLGANKNVYVQIKVPDSSQSVSEFMDCNLFFDTNPGETAGVETNGCFNGSQSALVSTVSSSGATNELNLGRHSVRGTTNSNGPDAVVLRIRAHKDWSGYLSEININWSV